MIHPDEQHDGPVPAAIRGRLAGANGPRFWRGLEELAETEEFLDYLHREFPRQASEWEDPTSRRAFFRLMAASMALAGVAGCSSTPAEKIVPYVRQPEQVVPGKPLFFASALTLGGYARGVLVESHMGRPTKVEGNEDHPDSLGATDVFAQAEVLNLYDPDRSQVVIGGGQVNTWEAFLAALTDAMAAKRGRKGAGLRLLTGTVTSPSLARQIGRLLEAYPEAKWHQYEPVARDGARAGARLAFGEDVETIYRVEKADVILALDADFLCHGPGGLRHAREFSGRRMVRADKADMNRLYAVECTPTTTGAMADHRLPVRAGEVAGVALALARELGLPVEGAGESEAARPHAAWIAALAGDLRKHRGAGLVVVGDGQPAVVHALAHAMNLALGNVGQTVVYTAPVVAQPTDQMDSIRELARAMGAGQVDMLVILGGNPAYDAPADVDFARVLEKVAFRVHLAPYEDETSARCHWHIPEAHALESWGDARAFDGTVSIIQPLIAPLYGGKTANEVLAALLEQTDRPGYEIVREYWREQKLGGDDFEAAWRTALHDGIIKGTAFEPRDVAWKAGEGGPGSGLKVEAAGVPGADKGDLEIVFRPDPTIYDGRFANNGWLQELPKPLTKLTWDNAALMSKATADRLGLANGDVVELRYRNRTVPAPAWVLPGHAEGSVTVHLGYGRTRTGRVGTGAGFNAYLLRTLDAPGFGLGLAIRKTGETARLACTQLHSLIEGRDIVRVGTLEQFRQDHHFLEVHEHGEPGRDMTLYPEHEYKGYAWGMAINLDTCIGCNACVVACQAENNIPVVGKDEVLRGREMHWLRIDRYYGSEEGAEQPEANPETYHQPVLCMHCENAPCELVCPVAATVHDAEGLNNMVYNRCVGTRYCSHNCPYKVRRFNFFQYADQTTPSLKLLNNPDVTVRSRGVMEKCSYCVQRINNARYAAEMEGRKVRDGEVVTACQQACPTRAIVFGDVNDKQSRVSRLKAEPLNYGLLAELNTRPRTTYLAKLTNPNPEIGSE